jgi:ubiquitin-conjugating enzyme E2 J2
MLSDEIMTGSVTTSDADKHAYAAHSHAWNIQQTTLQEMFPDVSDVPFASLLSADNLSFHVASTFAASPPPPPPLPFIITF